MKKAILMAVVFMFAVSVSAQDIHEASRLIDCLIVGFGNVLAACAEHAVDTNVFLFGDRHQHWRGIATIGLWCFRVLESFGVWRRVAKHHDPLGDLVVFGPRQCRKSLMKPKVRKLVKERCAGFRLQRRDCITDRLLIVGKSFQRDRDFARW